MSEAFRSIRALIVIAALLVSLLVAVAVYWATAEVFHRTVRDSATQMSATLADGTFNAMYQIMRQGWTREQLNEFLGAIRSQTGNDGLEIQLYRGHLVDKLFGDIAAPVPDNQAQVAFRTAKPQTTMTAGVIRYDRPLVAESQCLRCHVNARVGSVLGVMSIRQTVGPIMRKAHDELLDRLLVIMPLPLIAAVLVAALLGWRMARSLRSLSRAVDKVNRVEDLAQLRLTNTKVGFSELDGVLGKIDQLTGKLRDVAVDRDLLEFEIRLLERFVITSDVVRDWRRYVRELLSEINQVLPVRGVFTAFSVSDRPPGIDVFWYASPDETLTASISQRIQDLTGKTLGFEAGNLIPRQHVLDQAMPGLEDGPSDLDLRVKTLVMDTPAMHGMVGLVVPVDVEQTAVARLVIESILSTMLNVVGSVRAIEKHTEDLEFYATRDPLTNLYNQRMFWALLEYEVGRAERHDYSFGLFVIDMDNFKQINDTHGHAFGDQYLRYFADMLHDSLRDGDILSRYGGDEFVVILPETDADTAERVAERLLDRAREMRIRAPDDSEVGASISVGIALGPEHGRTARGLFSFADNMMYKAKSDGKNRVSIADAETVAALAQDIDEQDQTILHALEESRAIPYFQPIRSLADGSVVAVECLARIRWQDQLLPAKAFINIAEQGGYIEHLDLCMIQRVMEQYREQGFKGLIFVNVSPRSVAVEDFLSQVRGWVREAGLPPERLVFELSERDSLRDLAVIDRFVADLRTHGFKLAIDSAGSGLVSFQHLRRFHVDYVKIEGELLANLERSARDRAFFMGLIELARSLDTTVIVQQLEDEAQLAAIRVMGVDLVEGRLVGAPQPSLEAATELGRKPIT